MRFGVTKMSENANSRSRSPWHVSKHAEERMALIYDADGFEVARVCYPNRDINARLIASAPDLAARVERVELDLIEQRRLRDHFGDRVERLDAAIREAMALLDQPEPRPEAAFARLLLALNPDRNLPSD